MPFSGTLLLGRDQPPDFSGEATGAPLPWTCAGVVELTFEEGRLTGSRDRSAEGPAIRARPRGDPAGGVALVRAVHAGGRLPVKHNREVDVRDVLLAVWNRACDSAGAGVGDRHLSALLLVDGMVQNGGPNHAADSCEPAQLTAAAAAARYFGMDDVAALIEEMPAAAGGHNDEAVEDRLSEAYQRLTQDGERFDAVLQARYAAAPEDFEPV